MAGKFEPTANNLYVFNLSSVDFNWQLDAQLMALLIQNMDRLDEQIKEEADGVHNSLGMLRHSRFYCIYH